MNRNALLNCCFFASLIDKITINTSDMSTDETIGPKYSKGVRMNPWRVTTMENSQKNLGGMNNPVPINAVNPGIAK